MTTLVPRTFLNMMEPIGQINRKSKQMFRRQVTISAPRWRSAAPPLSLGLMEKTQVAPMPVPLTSLKKMGPPGHRSRKSKQVINRKMNISAYRWRSAAPPLSSGLTMKTPVAPVPVPLTYLKKTGPPGQRSRKSKQVILREVTNSATRWRSAEPPLSLGLIMKTMVAPTPVPLTSLKKLMGHGGMRLTEKQHIEKKHRKSRQVIKREVTSSATLWRSAAPPLSSGLGRKSLIILLAPVLLTFLKKMEPLGQR